MPRYTGKWRSARVRPRFGINARVPPSNVQKWFAQVSLVDALVDQPQETLRFLAGRLDRPLRKFPNSVEPLAAIDAIADDKRPAAVAGDLCKKAFELVVRGEFLFCRGWRGKAPHQRVSEVGQCPVPDRCTGTNMFSAATSCNENQRKNINSPRIVDALRSFRGEPVSDQGLGDRPSPRLLISRSRVRIPTGSP